MQILPRVDVSAVVRRAEMLRSHRPEVDFPAHLFPHALPLSQKEWRPTALGRCFAYLAACFGAHTGYHTGRCPPPFAPLRPSPLFSPEKKNGRENGREVIDPVVVGSSGEAPPSATSLSFADYAA